MRRTASALAVGLTLLFALAASCSPLPPYEPVECEACDQVCRDDLVCEEGRCVDPANPDVCSKPFDLCDEYCSTVMDNCPQNYVSLETCLGVCEQLPVGDQNEPTAENNVVCRLNAARAARQAAGSEVDLHCQAAGPGGNGRCGTNCEGYCLLIEQVCGEVLARVPDCEAACEALRDSERFRVSMSPVDEFDHSGDTVQCRLVHLSSAAGAADSSDAEAHCSHAGIQAALWCVDEAPSCEEYCRISGAACESYHAVYPSEEACLATCAVLDLGEVEDSAQDTIGCRTYHAKSALSDSLHCPHAGPTGDGHCGTDEVDSLTGDSTSFAACRPYCRILEAACPEQFSDVWPSSDACLKACNQSETEFGASKDQGYSYELAEISGDTLGCRVSQAVRALADPDNDDWCEGAFGGTWCAEFDADD